MIEKITLPIPEGFFYGFLEKMAILAYICTSCSFFFSPMILDHKPIALLNLTLSYGSKVCFEDFTTTIYPKDRIALMGRNGAGKSSLLAWIAHAKNQAKIKIPENLVIGYVPQVIETPKNLSGGERFQKALSIELRKRPSLLLLDEPTNHLDENARKGLIKMLQRFQGTLIFSSHDEELLRSLVDKLWIIDPPKITLFKGRYDDYLAQKKLDLEQAKKNYDALKSTQKKFHRDKMRAQEREANKKKNRKNIRERDRARRNKLIEQSEKTSAKNQRRERTQREEIAEKMSEFSLPPNSTPTFEIPSKKALGRCICSITEGMIAYKGENPLLRGITLSLHAREKIWIQGANGGGKSTLIRALLDDPSIIKSGEWHRPPRDQMGYLDQHYGTLDDEQSVQQHLMNQAPGMPPQEVKKHLSTFLFYSDQSRNLLVKHLSGGEKLRLSLALLAARPTTLLILDEVTNNIDLPTKNYLKPILKHYPGGMLLISHDSAFVESLDITHRLDISQWKPRPFSQKNSAT